MADLSQIEIVKQVHELYQTAFSDFVLVVGVVIGITGIFLPIFFAVSQFFQQRRELKVAHEKLDGLVKDAVQGVEARMVQESAKALEAFAARSEEQLRQARDEMYTRLLRLESATLQVQANGLFRSEEYGEAARSATSAVSGFIGCKDYKNLRRLFDGLICPCLRKMVKDDFKAWPTLEASIKEAVISVRGADENRAFSDLLEIVEKDLGNALIRDSTK